MNFDLPIISPGASPAFRDAKSCAAWLESLPLINVGPSHGRLLGELEELNCCSIAPTERLQILETLREAVLFVQTEHAKKFASRAVPLAKPERDILMNVLALWGAYGHGYMHCLQGLASVNRALLASSTQLAFACQRALWCVSRKINEHLRCYQEVPSSDWKLLHELQVFAEEHKLSEQQVDHPAQGSAWKTTCAETYSHPLLLQLANPAELSARQQGLAARWLDRWGNNAHIRCAPVPEGAPAKSPIVVDLAGSQAPDRQAHEPAPGLRYVDTAELGKSIRMRIGLLQKGDSPDQLQLGDDVPGAMAEQLLKLLHRLWCEDKPPRSPPRRSATGTTAFTVGMGALHFYIMGMPFRQPGETKGFSKAQHEEIATFGRTSTRADDEYALRNGFALEDWQIHDESLAGMRLERRSGAGRFVHTQLIGVRPPDARNFALATIRWLNVDQNYALMMGLQLMPGIPAGVAIRAIGLNAMNDKFVPALMLSAVPALRSPESLVLPVGWYRPKRVIELYSEKSRQVLLSAVLERGSDFERVAFEAA